MTMLVKNLSKLALQRISGGRFVFRYPIGRHVFLTFDDGPDENFTRQVLDILKEHGQRATFFLIGQNVDASPELAAEICHQGHRVGLHTHTHAHLDEMTKPQFLDEMNRNQESVRRAIGRTATILRPPRGRMRLKNLLWATQLELQVVHFTITSNDWKASSRDEVVRYVDLPSIRGGEIISFHDNNIHTVKALPVILRELEKAGMTSRSIPERSADRDSVRRPEE